MEKLKFPEFGLKKPKTCLKPRKWTCNPEIERRSPNSVLIYGQAFRVPNFSYRGVCPPASSVR